MQKRKRALSTSADAESGGKWAMLYNAGMAKTLE
jgi:hypothetical protein